MSATQKDSIIAFSRKNKQEAGWASLAERGPTTPYRTGPGNMRSSGHVAESRYPYCSFSIMRGSASSMSATSP